MDQNSVKLDVLDRWLAFVSSFIDLKAARLVTLGGRGLEAGLWQRHGVPAKNGWVVERGLVARKKFISDFPYHYCNTLNALPPVLESVYGNGYADAVHLDLCGTLESQLADFLPIMRQVVLNGDGARCLAITVADQRQNGTLEHFKKARAAAARLIGGGAAKRLLAALEKQQRQLPCGCGFDAACAFNPAKGAKKELGMITMVLGALLDGDGRIRYVPEQLQRFVYVSYMQGAPFRMRTYFIRFARLARGIRKKERALPYYAKRWISSPLTYLAAGTEVSVVAKHPAPQPVPKEKIMDTSTPKFPKLAGLVGLLGGETAEEFNHLLERDALAERQSIALAQIGLALSSASPGDPPPVVAKAKKTKVVKKLAVADAKPAGAHPRISTLEASLNLLSAEAEGGKAFRTAKAAAIKALGWSKLKNRGHKLSALIARTRGGHRGDFVYRATKGMPDGADKTKIIADLAAIYTKITGTEVTSAALVTEAAAAQLVNTKRVRNMSEANRK